MCAVCANVIRFVITENGLKSDYMNNYILWLFQWAVRVPFSCCLFCGMEFAAYSVGADFRIQGNFANRKFFSGGMYKIIFAFV